MFPLKLLMWTTCQLHVFQNWPGANSPEPHPQEAFKPCSCSCETLRLQAHTQAFMLDLSQYSLKQSQKKTKNFQTRLSWNEKWVRSLQNWEDDYSRADDITLCRGHCIENFTARHWQSCPKEHIDHTWSNRIAHFDLILLQIHSLDDTEECCKISSTYRFSPKIKVLFLAFRVTRGGVERIKERRGEGGGRERLLAPCHVFSVWPSS